MRFIHHHENRIMSIRSHMMSPIKMLIERPEIMDAAAMSLRNGLDNGVPIPKVLI